MKVECLKCKSLIKFERKQHLDHHLDSTKHRQFAAHWDLMVEINKNTLTTVANTEAILNKNVIQLQSVPNYSQVIDFTEVSPI